MIRKKAYMVKHSFDNDFVNLMEEMYKTYGEEIFSINGIANKHMDIVHFSKSFHNKALSNVADVSVDANGNVSSKSRIHYMSENNKALMKLNSLALLYSQIKKDECIEKAKKAIEAIINGEVFVNDLVSIDAPYCYAFALNNLLVDGMSFYQGNQKIKPPKHSSSFIALTIQTLAYVSNVILGAAAFPDFFVILDWFYRKEFGNDYVKELRENKFILNQFQNIIYSFNFPFRSAQSAFSNLSVLDRGFLEGLFGGYVYPDFSKPHNESILELSKIFFEYYSEINGVDGIFTFPVMTLALSKDNDGNFIDKETVEWASKANAEKCLGNIFMDKPTSFSSCCRLINDTSNNMYMNSFGVGGVSIGSVRVCGVNMARVSSDEQLSKTLSTVRTILRSQRNIVQKRIDSGYLPLYTTGWMSLKKQFSTIGVIGVNEMVENNNMTMTSEEGLRFAVSKMALIDEYAKKFQAEDGFMYNVEAIPGESVAVRLAKIDRILGYNGGRYELYSNQYLPLITEASIYKRLEVQGRFDNLTSGGAICHINVNDEGGLNKNQMLRMIETANDLNVKYFAINRVFSECSNGHFVMDNVNSCPTCSSSNIKKYTRVVGFLVPVDAWNKTRREYEFPKRIFHKNGETDVNN